MNLKKIKDSNIYNIIWFMFGSMIFGFSSLIYTIITTRVLGINAAGQYSFAFAVACTFYIIGVYFGRTFQITDNSDKYSDTDYIYNKLTTCLLMILFAVVFCLIKGYSRDKFLLIMILSLYRGVDAFLETIHAVIQKKGKIYKLGKLSFFRTIILIIGFLLSSKIFNNLILSCLTILIIDIIFVCLFDFTIAKRYFSISKYDRKKNLSLLLEGLSVFIFSFLAIYILNSPKYSIDTYATDEIQGLFAIIIMPSSFLALVSSFLIQPFVKEISENIKNNKYSKLLKLSIKLFLYIVTLGIFVLIVGYFLGIPVLNLFYDVNLNSYKWLFMLILLGSIFYSLYVLLSTIMISLRKNYQQVVILLIVCLFSIFICNYLVKINGLRGACYSYFYIMLFQLLLYMGVYIIYIIKLIKNENEYMKSN